MPIIAKLTVYKITYIVFISINNGTYIFSSLVCVAAAVFADVIVIENFGDDEREVYAAEQIGNDDAQNDTDCRRTVCAEQVF